MSSPIRPDAPVVVQSEDKRRLWPNLNAFRPFVMQELSRRKENYPTPINAPFVRVTACTEEPELGYAYFTMGLHGFDSTDLNIFDVTYGGNREIVGYAYDLRARDSGGRAKKRLISTDELTVGAIPAEARDIIVSSNTTPPNLLDNITAQQLRTQAVLSDTTNVLPGGAHPIPGITDITIERFGTEGSLRAKINYVCYNRAQLEYLRHHFMVVGQHVVVEWGNQFTDRQVYDVLDFSDIDGVKQELANAVMKGRSYVMDKYIRPNDGNYDFIVGTVGNYQLNIDPSTGVYKCYLEIYSIGENLWGISVPMTYVNKAAEIGSSDMSNATTISDFFYPGSRFDMLIEMNAKFADMVANNVEGWRAADKNQSRTTSEYANFRTNPNDYQFISWKFFTQVIIPQMFSVIENENVKKDLYTFLTFYRTGDGLSEEQQDWIGNNSYLLSTDPDVMILYKTQLGKENINAPTGFAGAGDFNRYGESRAKLTTGLWLNAGMVRECFASSTTFSNALRTLLSRLNGATRGFWNLSIYFDEDTNTYRITDNNYTTPIYPSFYKFNVGGHGETLHIELDSAFPPALITQMALFNSIRSRNPHGKAALERMASTGTTNTMIFALNWTNLRNVLEDELANRRGESAPATVTNPISDSQNTAGPRNTDRMLGGTAGSEYKQSGARTTVSSAPGTAVGNPFVVAPASLQNNLDVPVVRNSVAPITRPSDITDVSRLTQLTVQQVLDRQANRAMFAVGKYQFIPATLRGAIVGSGVSMTDKFDAITQERIFDTFLFRKRPAIKAYFDGRGSIESAQLALAQEFASIPVARQVKNDKGTIIFPGESYYKDRGNNRASHTVAETQRALQSKDIQVLKKLIARGEGNYDSINRGRAGDTRIGTPEYRTAINGATTPTPVFAQATPTPAPTPTTPTAPPTATTVGDVNIFTSNPQNIPVTTFSSPMQSAEQQQLAAWQANILERFGKQLIPLIALLPSKMIAEITKDGYLKHPAKSNAFVAPIPTTTAVTLTIVGLSGISITDGFYVDKLPFIFEQYGVFQVTGLTEKITDRGWLTTLRGYFRMLTLDATGPANPPITSL